MNNNERQTLSITLSDNAYKILMHRCKNKNPSSYLQILIMATNLQRELLLAHVEELKHLIDTETDASTRSLLSRNVKDIIKMLS